MLSKLLTFCLPVLVVMLLFITFTKFQTGDTGNVYAAENLIKPRPAPETIFVEDYNAYAERIDRYRPSVDGNGGTNYMIQVQINSIWHVVYDGTDANRYLALWNMCVMETPLYWISSPNILYAPSERVGEQEL